MSDAKKMPQRRAADHTFAICAFGESPYLEEAILSTLKQSVETNVLIATSTPNAHIASLAEKYGLPLFIREGKSSITEDWNFAYSQADTGYVTIAHQDDIYAEEYVRNLLHYMKKAEHPLIFFTDYGEIRGDQIVTKNKLLAIKRMLLFPLRPAWSRKRKWIRRASLAFGSAICCPSVTFAKANLSEKIFRDHFKVACDWDAWERLSRLDGEFIFCNKVLMYHRIHEESETTKQIAQHVRRKEELEIFRRFWPGVIAKLLGRMYAGAEKSNRI